MERSKKDWMKTVGKQRFRRWSISKPQPILHYCKTSNHFMFFCFSQSILIIPDILTKIYKITIACFKPTISVGSTLTHVRYYLDDPVHLLVSCAELQKCDCNFVHQVFGAVAGDCSSLDNWRFILLLRLGMFYFCWFRVFYLSLVSYFKFGVNCMLLFSFNFSNLHVSSPFLIFKKF